MKENKNYDMPINVIKKTSMKKWNKEIDQDKIEIFIDKFLPIFKKKSAINLAPVAYYNTLLEKIEILNKETKGALYKMLSGGMGALLGPVIELFLFVANEKLFELNNMVLKTDFNKFQLLCGTSLSTMLNKIINFYDNNQSYYAGLLKVFDSLDCFKVLESKVAKCRSYVFDKAYTDFMQKKYGNNYQRFGRKICSDFKRMVMEILPGNVMKLGDSSVSLLLSSPRDFGKLLLSLDPDFKKAAESLLLTSQTSKNDIKKEINTQEKQIEGYKLHHATTWKKIEAAYSKVRKLNGLPDQKPQIEVRELNGLLDQKPQIEEQKKRKLDANGIIAKNNNPDFSARLSVFNAPQDSTNEKEKCMKRIKIENLLNK
jgi:hypothetical protein